MVCVSIEDGRGAVGGGVVDDDRLEPASDLLVTHSCEAAVEYVCGIPGNDNYRMAQGGHGA